MLNDEEYTKRVLARASNAFHGDKVDADDFLEALSLFIEAGQRLDRIKKALFYGREFQWVEGYENAFAVENGTVEGSPQGNAVTHAILGIATESVELVEALHHGFLNPDVFDVINLQEEFGDVNWYRTLGLHALGQTHEENITQNDAKLEKRFGPAFSEDAANNRDLDAERAVLEGKDT